MIVRTFWAATRTAQALRPWQVSGMSAAYIADKDRRSIRIYTADDSRLVATIRFTDFGKVDDLLRAYGFSRTTPWATSDNTPDDHTVAALVKI